MSAKIIIASALTFMLIGCGGSNSSSCCQGIKAGEVAKGETKIVADSNGNVDLGKSQKVEASVGESGNEDVMTTIGVNSVSCEGSTCSQTPICPSTNPCNVTVVQTATDCGHEDMKPDLKLSQDVIDEAKEHYKNLADGKIVVQGGKIEIDETTGQVTSCGLDVEIKLPDQWCGRELGSGASTGFVYPFKEGDIVEVLITSEDGTKRWETAELRDGKIILKGLKDVKIPSTFTLFRVTDSEGKLSGVTGIFSGATE